MQRRQQQAGAKQRRLAVQDQHLASPLAAHVPSKDTSGSKQGLQSTVLQSTHNETTDVNTDQHKQPIAANIAAVQLRHPPEGIVQNCSIHQQLEHKQVSKRGTEPGVGKDKLSLLACHIRCKCSMKTTHKSMKVKLGIKIMKFVESLIG